jgi:hypothetical protein
MGSVSAHRGPVRACLEVGMLTTLIVALVVLWALGMATSYTLGGFIHGLLFLAVVVLLLKVFWERRPMAG